MCDITIIIPIYKLCEFRMRNFNFVIEHIYKLPCKVVVAEQTTKLKSNCFNKKNKINHKLYTTQKDIIHKSWLLNSALKEVDTEYTWFIDCDWFTDFYKIYKQQEYTMYDFYQPYYMCKDLNEVQTQQVVQTNKIHDSMYDTNHSSDRVIKMLGSLSLICKTESLLNIDGFDEKYVGWGLEDIDLFMNITKSPGINIGKNNKVNSVHLWHPITSKMRCTGKNNLLYFKSKGYTTARAIQMYKQAFPEY